jgi:hypothetical protein
MEECSATRELWHWEVELGITKRPVSKLVALLGEDLKKHAPRETNMKMEGKRGMFSIHISYTIPIQ